MIRPTKATTPPALLLILLFRLALVLHLDDDDYYAEAFVFPTTGTVSPTTKNIQRRGGKRSSSSSSNARRRRPPYPLTTNQGGLLLLAKIPDRQHQDGGGAVQTGVTATRSTMSRTTSRTRRRTTKKQRTASGSSSSSSSTTALYRQQPQSSSSAMVSGTGTYYGRDGAEKIWPPTNENVIIRLRDSIIDYDSVATTATMRSTTNTNAGPGGTGGSRRWLGYRRPVALGVTLIGTVYKLLRIAAAAAGSSSTSTAMTAHGCGAPLFDILALIGISGYIFIVHRLDMLSTPSNNDRSNVSLYDRPLGPVDTIKYEVWDDRVGTYLGIILPFLCFCGIDAGSETAMANTNTLLSMVLGRPVIWYCAQRLTEYIANNNNDDHDDDDRQSVSSVSSATAGNMSLPLRALIPIIYTAIRLLYYAYYCYNGMSMLEGLVAASSTTASAMAATASSSSSVVSVWTPTTIVVAVLTTANLLYAAIHLFFILPWVALRHLRIHCFLVEAEHVQLRDEASIGMTPTTTRL